MMDGWEGGDPEPGFSLHLRFARNPFLETEELALYCNTDYDVMRATPPAWREEANDPTIKLVTKKVKKKGGGAAQKRTVSRPAESFFRIFQEAEEDDDFDPDGQGPR